MKPAPFDYARPRSLDEAVALLASSKGSAKLLAGGQSLAPMLNLRLVSAELLVDLGGIAGLNVAEDRGATVFYGAMIPHAAFEDGLHPDAGDGLMSHAASRIAFRSVRNRGTIGGALALADPAADWLPTLVALNAVIHVRGQNGARRIEAEDFILGPYFTALGEDEIIEGVEAPRLAPDMRWGHSKMSMKVGEYAQSLAVALVDPRERSARVVLGAAEGPPIVFNQLNAGLLDGKAERLADSVRGMLASADRNFTSARLTMHTTTVVRTIRNALQ